MKLKYTFLSILLTVFIAQPTWASPLNDQDMAIAFTSSATSSDIGELALLSDEEMKETEGEWWPVYHGLGALIGMYSGGYGYLAAGGRDYRGFLGSAFGGALTGAFSPVRSFSSAALAFGGGTTAGIWNAWW